MEGETMANDYKKDDQTQVLDLGLGQGSPGLNVSLGNNASSSPVFNLAGPGSLPGAQESQEAQVAASQGQLVVEQAVPPGASFGDTNMNNPTISYRNVFTQDVKVVEKRKISPIVQVLLAGLVVIAGVVGFVFYTTGDVSNLFAMLGLEDENAASVKPSAPKTSTKDGSSAKGQMADTRKGQGKDGAKAMSDAANGLGLWARVKNEMGGELPPKGKNFSTDQEASFKAGLNHEFNYQRYKTVLDLAADHAPGSQELLREALESRKFWIRMRALIALADLGDEISDADVAQALGDAHSELRARFFKRFEKAPCSVGCFYVARASLKQLDARGRSQVLKVIAREGSDVRDVYMIAATMDQDEFVRNTAHAWLDTRNIDQALFQDVKARYGIAH